MGNKKKIKNYAKLKVTDAAQKSSGKHLIVLVETQRDAWGAVSGRMKQGRGQVSEREW